MKKILSLPLLAVMALASQAWGAYASCKADLGDDFYCDWGTGCYELNKGKDDTDNCATVQNNCKKDGYLFVNVTDTGDNKKCKDTGEWAGEGNNPNFNNGVSIWCKWATSCQPLKNQTDLNGCIKDGSVFKEVPATGIGEGKACEGGIWTGEGKNPNATVLGCCKWSTETKCWPIYSGPDPEDGEDGEKKVTLCKGGTNQFWSGACPAPGDGTCPITPPVNASSASAGVSSSSANTPSSSSAGISSSSVNTPSSSSAGISSSSVNASSSSISGSSSSGIGNSSSSSEEDTPIISHNKAPVAGLSVIHFARSLQIASGKNATVALFDMQGKQVFSQKVLSGTTILSLEKQRQGIYYAVVSSGSQKQTVKVVLK